MVNEALQTYLENFVSTDRMARLRQVVAHRTRQVTVVLEDVYQTQNASAAIRTAECMGLQELHIIKNGPGYKVNKHVVKGAHKWIDIHKYIRYPNNTETCLMQLKARGYRIIATTPGEETVMLPELMADQKTAFVFGTEKYGVSKDVLDRCDTRMLIPMYGFTESYNLSVSVALCLFHFITQAKKQNTAISLDEQEQKELLHKWTKMSIKKCDLIIQEFYTKHGGKI